MDLFIVQSPKYTITDTRFFQKFWDLGKAQVVIQRSLAPEVRVRFHCNPYGIYPPTSVSLSLSLYESSKPTINLPTAESTPTWQVKTLLNKMYTGCPRRKGPNFGRVFLRSNYTDITQNTYILSSMVTEILNIEKWGLVWCLRTVLCPWRHTRRIS